MMKRFLIMPLKIGNNRFEECQFVWERKISHRDGKNMQIQNINQDIISYDGRFYWLKLGEQIAYCPTDDDVAHYIRVTCTPKEGDKLVSVSRTPVEIGPPRCPFEKRHEFTRPPSSHFRIMSYNILADLYADSQYSKTVLFAHCPTHALSLDYRRQLLLKEIPGYNATIICLQEVDEKEFKRTFEPYLNIIGRYKGVFAKKGGKVAEGLATFVHQDEFEMIEQHRTFLPHLIEHPALDGDNPTPDQDHHILNTSDSVEIEKCLRKFDEIRKIIVSNESIKNRFMGRNTVLQTNLLRSKKHTDNFLLVANTHLYFAPNADYIRALQGSVCVKYLEYLKDYYTRCLLPTLETSDAMISVIFCGDMNSLPNNAFPELMTRGKVDSSHPDWSRNKDEKNKDEVVEGLEVETDLRFSSAYQEVPYTNYVPNFQACIDYIFYEKESIHCDSVVPLPDHEDVILTDGLPNIFLPSDHLALVADMSFSS